MTAFPSYSTGTVAIGAGATTVVGTGSNWSGQNAIPGDLLVVAGNTVIVQDVTDALHLAIDAWPFAAVTAGTAYKLYKVSPLRFAGGQAMAAVDTLVAALNTSGFYVFVGPTETVPDPSLGDDEQYALQATTGKLWQKTSGTWNFIGTQKGFGLAAPWNSATAYLPFDVTSLSGTSYVCILANTNQTPPNATYWTVLAAKGDAATVAVGTVTTGAGGSAAAVTNAGTSGAAVLNFTIPQGLGYGGSSTTSFAIGTGSKAFTTQAGLAYLVGNYVRAASAANGVNFMEGAVTAYSGTTLTINITKIGGSGTHADWNLSVSGVPGAGDLLSTNNGTDFANVDTTLTNLRGISFGAAQTLALAQQIQAYDNIAILRQNMALHGIYSSKSWAALRRVVNEYYDGFIGVDGVFGGGSANFSAVTGAIGPTSAQVQFTNATAIGNMTGGGGLAAAFNGVTSQAQAASASLALNGDTTVGQDWGSGVTKTVGRFTVFGPNDGGVLNTVTLSYNLQGSNDNSTWINLFTGTIPSAVSSVTDVTSGITTTTAYRYHRIRGTGNGANLMAIAELRFYPVQTFNNMTLVTTNQTADASSSNVRALVEYDDSASPVVNTDFTAEVSCDGGTHWTVATLTLVTANSQGGRAVAETVDQATTAGTSIAVRLKTLTGKNIIFYGLAAKWH